MGRSSNVTQFIAPRKPEKEEEGVQYHCNAAMLGIALVYFTEKEPIFDLAEQARVSLSSIKRGAPPVKVPISRDLAINMERKIFPDYVNTLANVMETLNMQEN